MHSIFESLVKNITFTNDLKTDMHSFLTANNCPITADHCLAVGSEARKLAGQFSADADAAEIAGWLHDISAVFPNDERIAVSRELGVHILHEEQLFPMIIHQKISKVMAKDIFGITDVSILNAVGCHTTLRVNSTLLDQVLFVADKIVWDQSGLPPYIDELNVGLTTSIKHGAFSYINFLWQRKETLKVVHPWLIEAYEELQTHISSG